MTKTPGTCIIDFLHSSPSVVARQIFSLLSMEDISRLSVVSRRFRQLCMSTPFLTFDDTIVRSNASKRARFINYLDRLLVLRRSVHTNYFCIHWSLQSSLSDEEYRFLSWLHSMDLNVEQLDLDVILGNESDFALPSCLFRCVSLKTLVVNFQNGFGIFNMIPSSVSPFSFLECLKLCSVQINESFGTWISSYFKSLKQLHLRDIKGTNRIDITSSSLEEMVILLTNEFFHFQVSAETLKTMCLSWNFDSPNDRELQLSAPNLENLFLFGNISKSQFAGDFMHLKCAVLSLSPPNSDVSSTESLVHLLRAVHNVTKLSIQDVTLQALKQSCLTSPLPISFPFLFGLSVWISAIIDDLVPVMASIFERTPNLHDLHIMRKTSYMNQTNASAEVDGRTTGSWELQDGMAVQNLNFVTMNLFSLGKNELKLIKYLLKYAYNLQKMTLYLDHSLLSDAEREINQYEKASNAQVKYEGL